MKFKAFFLYIGIGAAFLAVSLWVFLSGGKNAKAIRTKYKLGGALLTAWAMLSASTCSPIPTVTCYEPVPPEQPMCYDVVIQENALSLQGDLEIKRGSEVVINVDNPTYENYLVTVKKANEENPRQEERVALSQGEVEYQKVLKFTLSKDLPEGDAQITVWGIYQEEGQAEQLNHIFTFSVTLL